MTTQEAELKALMLASLDGDAASHRALLDRLSRRLRAYYKGKLARIGRGAAEAEDLVQAGDMGVPHKATYIGSRRAADAVGARNRALQADRPPSRQQDVADRCPDRRSSGTDGEGRPRVDRGDARHDETSRPATAEDTSSDRSRQARRQERYRNRRALRHVGIEREDQHSPRPEGAGFLYRQITATNHREAASLGVFATARFFVFTSP